MVRACIPACFACSGKKPLLFFCVHCYVAGCIPSHAFTACYDKCSGKGKGALAKRWICNFGRGTHFPAMACAVLCVSASVFWFSLNSLLYFAPGSFEPQTEVNDV